MDEYLDQCMNQFVGARHNTAWQLISAYWHSGQRFPVYIFLFIVITMTVPMVSRRSARSLRVRVGDRWSSLTG